MTLATTIPPSAHIEKDRTDAQPVSIHFLKVPKITKFFSDSENTPLPTLVKKVVDYYNAGSREHHYEQIVQEQVQGNYQFAAFAQRVRVISRMANWLTALGSQVDLTTQKAHYLFFYYREWSVDKKPHREIFALTTGQSYRVLGKFIDYRFRSQIARRLFSPQSCGSETRPLVGDVLIHSDVLKKPKEIQDSEAVNQLFTRMKFQIRDNASLRGLRCFRPRTGGQCVRTMTAEIGAGLVRLNTRLDPASYPEVLAHFSSIAWGRPTYSIQLPNRPPQAEADSEEFDYLDYLCPVDFTLTPRLDKQLSRYVYLSVCEDRPFPPFDFCHSARGDYFRGTNHALFHRRKRWECQDPFSASSMVEMLKIIPALKACKDDKAFNEELAYVKVSFISNGKTISASFLDFFEGEMHLSDGDVVWRLYGMWYQVKADYLALVHQDFAKALEKSLVSSGEPGTLPLQWLSPSEKEARKKELLKAHQTDCNEFKANKRCSHKPRFDAEAEYNQLYLSRDGYLLGDKICPQGIELFDILQITANEVFLYHVKEGFGQSTRDACSQVCNAAKHVNSMRQKGSSNIFDHVYDMATSYNGNHAYRKATKEKYLQLGKKKFCKALSQKKIVIVYAFADDAKEARLLAKDRTIQLKVQPCDIEKVNARFKKNGQDIFNALVKENYLTRKGHLTARFFASGITDTSTYLFSPSLIRVDNQRRCLYRELCIHASQFDSTIAKLEILRTQREVENLGFTFRICQIGRTDYPKDATALASSKPPSKPPSGGHILLDDELPDLDEEEKQVLRNEIREGSNFTHGEDSYHIVPTEADFACGLHALLGEENEAGKCIFSQINRGENPNQAVRRIYRAKFEERYQELKDQIDRSLIKFVKDHLNKDNPNNQHYIQMIFNPIQNEVNQLTQTLAHLTAEETLLKQTLGQVYVELANSPDRDIQDRLVGILPQSLDTYQNSQKDRVNDFNSHFNQLSQATQNTEIGTRLAANRASLNDCERRKENAYFQFVGTQAFRTAYLNACSRPDYFLSEEDIHIGGLLFDKKVKFYAHMAQATVYNPQELGADDGDEVVIFHKTNHFSRCEPIEDVGTESRDEDLDASSANKTNSQNSQSSSSSVSESDDEKPLREIVGSKRKKTSSDTEKPQEKPPQPSPAKKPKGNPQT